MSLYTVGATWDERRNTSRLFEPDPGAVDAALRAIRVWRRLEPAHAQWVADGAPALTEAEHLERFGGAYQSHRKRGRR